MIDEKGDADNGVYELTNKLFAYAVRWTKINRNENLISPWSLSIDDDDDDDDDDENEDDSTNISNIFVWSNKNNEHFANKYN